jgi:hypothetical protein
MNGGDPGAIATAIINWYGSGAGGRFLLLALLLTCVFAAFHVTSWRTPTLTLIFGGLAWGASYALKTWMGWAT